VLVGIERADGFAEHLADAIAAIGPRRDIGADAVMARVESTHGSTTRIRCA